MVEAVALAVTLTWVAIGRAVLVHIGVLPPTCHECGLVLERRHLGGRACSCVDVIFGRE